MANLKAHATGMSIYAADWGKLPADNPAAGGGLILWDITVEMTDKQLASVGLNGGAGVPAGADKATAVRKVFYCPLAPDANQPSFWNYTGGLYRVAGYYFLNNRKNTTLQALVPPKYAKTTTTGQGNMDDGELVLDVVMDKIGTPNSFSDIVLGGGGGFTTSHMKGKTPDGSNIAFIDGHVDFRPFKKMAIRYTSTKAGAGYVPGMVLSRTDQERRLRKIIPAPTPSNAKVGQLRARPRDCRN